MNWPKVKIEDIFDVARGGSPRPINDFLTDQEDGVNWIMIGDTKGSGKYIETTAKKIKPEGVSKSRMVKEGDFLLTNSMSFGKPYILKTNGCIHDGWLVLSPLSDEIFTDYFYYYLGSDEIKMRLTAKAAGAVVKNLNKDIVKNLQIPLPPLATQKKIAAILDAADAHRQKTKQLLAKYDELAQSIFLEMFGDPVGNNRKWEVKRMGDLCSKITTGSTPKGGKETYQEDGVPFYRCQNVWRGYFKTDDIAFLSPEVHKSLKKSSLLNGDILMTKTGRLSTENSSLGRAAMYEGGDNRGNISTDVFLIRTNHLVSKEYLSFLLSSDLFRDYIRGESVGGTDKRHLYKEHLQNFKIIYPPVELQKKFSNILISIQSQKKLVQPSLELSQTLFDSLLQKAFKGELVK